ncbi:LuxR C-terminal-related transcriptional regulator [Qipengyuania qiaonensis]|uniref:Response regulator transcription factor n=1 Tax=Qipengyuania qiaonensis TaxID=2867240 RepID=A0ABS7JC19_9SPHN|nr:response regulator transcription factor [Qipengyuania qiaonensis]MBX7483389.1 response regulator transcription factor [Qipengyuania qiaonensis]
MRTVSTSVSLICSNSITSEGLKSILLDEEFSIVGQHKNCAALITAKEEGGVDVGMIVVDADALGNVAKEVVEVRQAFPESRVVVLHEDLTVERLVDVFDAGADGYILKEISCESLVNCLQLAARGEKVVPGQLVKQLPHFARATADQAKAEGELSELLSEREIATLRCLVMGYPNKVIARRLDIGEATVKVHVKAILRKLNVQNRTQAAICAVNHGVQATMSDLNLRALGTKANDAMGLEETCDTNGVAPFMLADNHAQARPASA